MAVFSEPKPVKCHVCDRGFKNIAALNGHMRLHGGYVRKVRVFYHCILLASVFVTCAVTCHILLSGCKAVIFND